MRHPRHGADKGPHGAGKRFRRQLVGWDPFGVAFGDGALRVQKLLLRAVQILLLFVQHVRLFLDFPAQIAVLRHKAARFRKAFVAQRGKALDFRLLLRGPFAGRGQLVRQFRRNLRRSAFGVQCPLFGVKARLPFLLDLRPRFLADFLHGLLHFPRRHGLNVVLLQEFFFRPGWQREQLEGFRLSQLRELRPAAEPLIGRHHVLGRAFADIRVFLHPLAEFPVGQQFLGFNEHAGKLPHVHVDVQTQRPRLHGKPVKHTDFLCFGVG